MNQLARYTLIPTFVGLLASMPLPGPAFAQAHAAPVFEQRQVGFSQAELDQMLAPIALYPDALLSQVLIATTYWPEVAEAARFSLEHPELTADDALRVVQGWNWHPSVKSLLAFPQLLAMMGQRPDWVASLGDAFLVQQARVMDSIQVLRQRAQAAGSLQSNGLISIVQQGPVVSLVSPDPQVIYAPWYDANLVYGRWWWPRHPPLVWTAWGSPFGARSYTPGVSPHVVGLPTRLFFGAFDWQRREARMVHAQRSFGLSQAPHAHVDFIDRRASAINGRVPVPGSGFSVAPAANATARQPVTLMGSDASPGHGRRHQPPPQAGQALAPAAAVQAVAPAPGGARDPLAVPHGRRPEIAPPALPQATAPSPRAAMTGQSAAPPMPAQAPPAAANPVERPSAIAHPAPPAGAHRPAHAPHSFRADRPAAAQPTEATGRAQSAEGFATRAARLQQPQGAQPGAAANAPAVRSGPMSPPAPVAAAAPVSAVRSGPMPPPAPAPAPVAAPVAAPVEAARAATNPATMQARTGHRDK